MVTLEIAAAEFVRRFQAGEIPSDARVVVTYQEAGDPALELVERWIAEAPKDIDAEADEEADADLRELQQALNATRRQAGARVLYPDVAAL